MILGFPVLLMELALGRAGRSTFPGAFRKLQNKAVKFNWGIPAYILFSGNMILLMFYTVVTGWLVAYTFKYSAAVFKGLSIPGDFAKAFTCLTGNPGEQIFFMLVSVLFSMLICMGGVKNVLESVIKVMMLGLFALLLILVVRAVTLPNAKAGLSFYLMPDLAALNGRGFGNLLAVIHGAMAQAFFTLSLGIGAIAIFGSYTSRQRSLAAEGRWIVILDTIVAICGGLIIFPACFAFDIKPTAGPSLIFITLPNVFHQMRGGDVWGIIFFVFMSIAALSTLIAVFENLVALGIDEFKWNRVKSCSVFGLFLAVLSIPCVLGFNVWSGFQPFGNGSCVLDLEDFIVSDNLLPLGALYLSIFCMSGKGWGAKKFFRELNTGRGKKYRRYWIPYLRWCVPVIIFAIWLIGILGKFGFITKI